MSMAAPKGSMVDEEDCGCQAAIHSPGEALAEEHPATLRQIDPGARFLICCLFALATVSLDRLPHLAVALALSVGMAVAARLEAIMTLRRLAALDGFMLMVLGMLPFSIPGDALFSLAGYPASQEGLLRALQILLKSNAVMLMILALLGSMEPSRLGLAMSRLGAPDKFVHLFLFTLRYIEVLGREYRRLRLAMKARGFRMRCDLHTWRSVGYLFGMLLVHSIERSERIVAAMRCRGFNGQFHLLAETAPIRRRDQAFTGLSAATCLALAVLGHL